MQDLENQTKGVEMSRRKAIIDVIPSAYKNIDDVMSNQKDLVEVVHTLKQIVNIKGD
jgi:tRNA-splicing ligase RtcB